MSGAVLCRRFPSVGVEAEAAASSTTACGTVLEAHQNRTSCVGCKEHEPPMLCEMVLGSDGEEFGVEFGDCPS
jgi:hypothetical protein